VTATKGEKKEEWEKKVGTPGMIIAGIPIISYVDCHSLGRGSPSCVPSASALISSCHDDFSGTRNL